MDIVEIQPTGNVVVDSANNLSGNDTSTKLQAVNIFGNFTAPKIFGKDIHSAQIAIYGALLSENNIATNVE